jgi:hypothetical protein
MTNAITRKPLVVSTGGGAGPYIKAPVSQLDEIRQILDSHGIRYWVSHLAISWDGAPEVINIEFGLRGDAQAIQSVLDSCSKETARDPLRRRKVLSSSNSWLKQRN